MSTPFSSLKKTRRPPFRSPNLSTLKVSLPSPGATPIDFECSDDEINSLVDEVTSHMASQKLKKDVRKWGMTQATPTEEKSPSDSAGPNDHELMSLMVSKLTRLERKNRQQEFDLAEKTRRCRVLEDKVRVLQKANVANQTQPSKVRDLEKKCLLLQQQIYEMETFLADYGLIWVGESPTLSDDDEEENFNPSGRWTTRSGEWRPSHSLSSAVETPRSTVAEFHLDFDHLVAALGELNNLAGAEEARVEHSGESGSGQIARLKRPDPVPLTIFANGIVLFGGPFRSYTDPETVRFTQDILDGYFPSELESRFPDGIPFAVKDRREAYFKDRLTDVVFRGEGQRLGGTKGSSVLVGQPGSEIIEDSDESALQANDATEVTSVLPGRKLTLDQFLHNLPQCVVKEGKLIDIRSAVKQTVNGTSTEHTTGLAITGQPMSPRQQESANQQTVLVDTSSLREMHERVESGRVTSRTGDDRVTTIRVKAEDGRQTYILKMKFTETMADLHRYLNSTRSNLAGKYDIVATFPFKVLSDDKMTMVDYGLVPNATLHLKKKSHK